MKENKLIKAITVAAIGGLSVKAVQIFRYKKMQKEMYEVVEDEIANKE